MHCLVFTYCNKRQQANFNNLFSVSNCLAIFYMHDQKHPAKSAQSDIIQSLCANLPGVEWEAIRKMSSQTTHQGAFVQSSQLTKPLWTDPDIREWTWCMSASKSTGGEWFVEPSSKILTGKEAVNSTEAPWFDMYMYILIFRTKHSVWFFTRLKERLQ